MKKKEWQEFHGFDDEDMDRIDGLIKTFKADPKSIKVFTKPFQERMADEQAKRKRRRELTGY